MATKKIATKTTASAPQTAEETPKPVAKKAAKPATKAAAKTASPAPASVPAIAKTPAPAANKIAAKPSLDTIARAAYLNYRRRVEQGLPGNSHGDWLEAERKCADAG